MSRLPVAITALLLAGAAVAGVAPAGAHAPAPSPTASAAAACVIRPVTPQLQKTLLRTFRKAHSGAGRKATGPIAGPGQNAGQCGSTYWAAASFNTPGVGTAGQPEAFRRTGATWHDVGDGKALCRIPAALRTLWEVPCPSV